MTIEFLGCIIDKNHFGEKTYYYLGKDNEYYLIYKVPYNELDLFLKEHANNEGLYFFEKDNIKISECLNYKEWFKENAK